MPDIGKITCILEFFQRVILKGIRLAESGRFSPSFNVVSFNVQRYLDYNTASKSQVARSQV
jgi:hypothetical protein